MVLLQIFLLKKFFVVDVDIELRNAIDTKYLGGATLSENLIKYMTAKMIAPYNEPKKPKVKKPLNDDAFNHFSAWSEMIAKI